MAKWDQCVDPALAPIHTDRELPVLIGVDASVKHDSTAILGITPQDHGCIRLVTHRVFQPSPAEPLDFEAAIEETLIDLCRRFKVVKILYDPYQLQATMQRLQKRGLLVREFPQTVSNLTLASQNLYELIESRSLLLYPDAAMRLAASRAVAVETVRGWRVAKEKQSHKIDVIVALAMAAHAATSQPAEQRIPFVLPCGIRKDGSSNYDSLLARAEARPAPAPGDRDLEEQHHTLTSKRNELEREIGRCAEPALTDPAVRAKRDQLMTDQAAVAAELKQVRDAMAKRDANQSGPSTTELWYRAAGGSALGVYWGPVDVRGPIP